MKALNHPEYAEEAEQLAHTIAYIEAEIARPFRAGGADARADYALALENRKYKSKLKESREQAYFARVDERSGEAGRHKLYIGKHFIHRLNIYSWADTRAGDLYYKASRDVLLKRNYEISFDTLEAIRDQFVHPSLAGVLVAEQFTDSLLHKMLQESRSGSLHDIVATIQEQQYHIIQAPKNTLMVVQGVPGSGKSSIALHRLAYLLYNNRSTMKKILVLGPSPLFLDYIGNILPALGEHNVPHNTFGGWLVEKLGRPIAYHPQEHLLELLLGPSVPDTEKRVRHRNALNKGSLKMAALLERYIGILQNDILSKLQSLVCRITLPARAAKGGLLLTTDVSTEKQRAYIESLHNLPLNRRRAEMERRLAAEVVSELTGKARERFGEMGLSPFEYDDREVRRSIEGEVTKQVHDHFAFWHTVSATVAYRTLLRTPALLAPYNDIFSVEELDMLALYPPRSSEPVDYVDLAPLVYLKLLLDGTGRGRSKGSGSDAASAADAARLYDHIVIDEAQDISPLYLRVLDLYTRASSMTVLGDLAQGVYTENAVNSWQDLLAASGGANVQTEAIQQSYRSTREIIEYANDMLRRTGADSRSFAEPVARKGSKPSISLFYSRATFLKELLKDIRREQLAGYISIALICKTAADCRVLAGELDAAKLTDYQLMDTPDVAYGGKLAIIPAYLTKGLEFDSVVVVDADAANYPPTELSARLLYVALTRASHSLYVCSIKTISPLLDDTIRRVTLQPAFAGMSG